jgi:hypothetical protein
MYWLVVPGPGQDLVHLDLRISIPTAHHRNSNYTRYIVLQSCLIGIHLVVRQVCKKTSPDPASVYFGFRAVHELWRIGIKLETLTGKLVSHPSSQIGSNEQSHHESLIDSKASSILRHVPDGQLSIPRVVSASRPIVLDAQHSEATDVSRWTFSLSPFAISFRVPPEQVEEKRFTSTSFGTSVLEDSEYEDHLS